jgi:uncharacterized RDD family membrane protein YckC
MTGENSFVHPGEFDQLNIETPEQVDLRFPVAGIGSRFLALLADTLLIALFYALLGLLAYATSSGKSGVDAMDRQSTTAQNWWAAGFILVNFLMVWGYFTLQEGLWRGQTLGKRWMKLRVIKDSGRGITLFESMARNLMRVIDAMPGFYLAGVISMLCTRSQQRLGDLVAGTIVVHERVDEQPLLAQHQSRTFTASLFAEPARVERKAAPVDDGALAADAVARLGPADLHLIETFFARALDLTLDRRAELATRVAATLCGRMAVALPEGMQPERLLEMIAYRMRGQGRF